MTAYVVMIRNTITNEDELAKYASLARQARGEHPITNLVAYGELITLEGDPVDGMFIHEFPTVEAAKAWYNSDAYQLAVPHRKAGAEYQVLIVEGRAGTPVALQK